MPWIWIEYRQACNARSSAQVWRLTKDTSLCKTLEIDPVPVKRAAVNLQSPPWFCILLANSPFTKYNQDGNNYQEGSKEGSEISRYQSQFLRRHCLK